MSNGKWWTDEEHQPSSNEEATRAVPRDQFLSAVATPNQQIRPISNSSPAPLVSSRDQTRVAQAESFPNQDPTKAISADQFYQMAAKVEAFEHDTSEDKTKALNTTDFNFQSPFNQQVSQPQVSQPQVHPWRPPLSSQSPTQSQNFSVTSEPYSVPSDSQYPSPQPRTSATNSFNPVQDPSLQVRQLQDYSQQPPSHRSNPEPYSVNPQESMQANFVSVQQSSMAETQPQTPAISNPSFSPIVEKALNSSPSPWQAESTEFASKGVEQVSSSDSSHFGQEDLTQAHLKSHVLAELITEHRYRDNSPIGQAPSTLKQNKSQRVKRSRLIIYGSVFLSILIIFAALGARYFFSALSINQRLNELNISLTQLKAPFALDLPSAMVGKQLKSTRVMNQNTLEQRSSLQILFNGATLFYADDISKVHNTLSVSASDLVPQTHPLRLNGAFLPKVINQLNHHWPDTKLQQVVLGAPKNSSAGMVLDLLSTFVVNHQRKGQNFTQYNLLIEQSTMTQATPIKQSSSNNRKLAILPFHLIVDNKQINRDEFLQVKWSKKQSSIFILGPKRKQREHFQLQRLRSSHEEDLLTQTFKEKVDQIGSLKGVLITVPRSILLTELALWLSVCAPYPIYLIPPKVSD